MQMRAAAASVELYQIESELVAEVVLLDGAFASADPVGSQASRPAAAREVSTVPLVVDFNSTLPTTALLHTPPPI